jgi:lipoprotein-releasing system ATP-binding protein
MAITIENLHKTFIKDGNRIEVLKGLDLEIADGESLALVGVSGAGKSTLIHILGTLDHPTEGRVLFDGTNVFTWPEKRLAAFRNTRIGFVFQLHNLLPEFTSLENTMLPALINGLTKRKAKEKAEGLLKDVGLGDRMSHKPGELSGGEQQRVAVARALIMAPDILLADEPTGNLDTDTGKKIEDLLIDFHTERHIILIVVTHNQSLAKRMSKSIGLRDGRINPCE